MLAMVSIHFEVPKQKTLCTLGGKNSLFNMKLNLLTVNLSASDNLRFTNKLISLTCILSALKIFKQLGMCSSSSVKVL